METSGHRPVDVLIGASELLLVRAGAVRRRAEPVVEPLGRLLLRPPLVPARLQPAAWLDALGERGAGRRLALTQDLSRLLDAVVPAVVGEVLRRAGLTEKLTDYVDLDAVVAAVDLDAAAGRLDVNAVVRRVDVDSVVAAVDLDAAAERIDVDAVARRLDLDSVLDRIDLTDVVLTRVDLDALVAAVLARIDLARLAEEVIDEIDLPEIIRESSGSMASDTVQGVRMQGIAADEAVGRAVDRLLLRRRHRE